MKKSKDNGEDQHEYLNFYLGGHVQDELSAMDRLRIRAVFQILYCENV